jgi:hypothetical protein
MAQEVKDLILNNNTEAFSAYLKETKLSFGDLYELSKFCIEKSSLGSYAILLEYGISKNFFPHKNLEMLIRSSVVHGNQKKELNIIGISEEVQYKMLLIYFKFQKSSSLLSTFLEFLESNAPEKFKELKEIATDLNLVLETFLKRGEITESLGFLLDEKGDQETINNFKRSFVLKKNSEIKADLEAVYKSKDLSLDEKLKIFYLLLSFYLPEKIKKKNKKTSEVVKETKSFFASCFMDFLLSSISKFKEAIKEQMNQAGLKF